METPKEPASDHISFRVSPKTKKQIQLAAGRADVSVATYLVTLHADEQKRQREALGEQQSGTDRDVPALLRQAEQGDPESQYRLGLLCADGNGIAQSYQKAFEFFLSAAQQGHVGAIERVRLAYVRGEGVAKSTRKSISWARRGARMGHPASQYALAHTLEFGVGAPPSLTQAANWYLHAAGAGDGDAMWAVGLMYFEGRGVSKNVPIGLDWMLSRSPSDLDYDAHLSEWSGGSFIPYVVAKIYRHGIGGIARNPQRALQFCEFAERLGNEAATNELAEFRLEAQTSPIMQEAPGQLRPHVNREFELFEDNRKHVMLFSSDDDNRKHQYAARHVGAHAMCFRREKGGIYTIYYRSGYRQDALELKRLLLSVSVGEGDWASQYMRVAEILGYSKRDGEVLVAHMREQHYREGGTLRN